MSYLLLFSIISIASFSVLLLIIFLGARKLRLMDQYSLERALFENSGFLSKELNALGQSIIVNFKKIFSHPDFLKFLEIFVRKIRIVVLKVENTLLDIIDYLRGKRKNNSINSENASEFLKEMNDWKNGNDKV